jgi:demethylmenaquinone methyltransferase/2-methoxy-6-polyprenyl-1,4-benzoquinol methylase
VGTRAHGRGRFGLKERRDGTRPRRDPRLYRRRAARYDWTTKLYYLIGFRLHAYRQCAVASLALEPGDTVVEIACGTGLNFELLEQAVGPSGKIVGVDVTDAMLAQARRRVEREGWRNVDLVAADAASYEFPAGAGGILSTFALTLIPEFDEVIARGARALAAGRRWVVADLKMPGWPGAPLCARLLLPFYRPFADARPRRASPVGEHGEAPEAHEGDFALRWIRLRRGRSGMRSTRPPTDPWAVARMECRWKTWAG